MPAARDRYEENRLSKLSVTDLAADLGITTDDLIGMLRSLEVVVRAPGAPLTDDQVARVRARWEREKRARAAKAAAPAAAPARRRKAADAPSEPADAAAAATPVADETVVEAPKAAAKPKSPSK
jgi:translation initiation factor IF-2